MVNSFGMIFVLILRWTLDIKKHPDNPSITRWPRFGSDRLRFVYRPVFSSGSSLRFGRFLPHTPCIIAQNHSENRKRCRQTGSRPIDDTDPVGKFSIDPGSHTDLQNPAEFSPKGKPIRKFSIDPTSSIRTSIADAVLADASTLMSGDFPLICAELAFPRKLVGISLWNPHQSERRRSSLLNEWGPFCVGSLWGPQN